MFGSFNRNHIVKTAVHLIVTSERVLSETPRMIGIRESSTCLENLSFKNICARITLKIGEVACSIVTICYASHINHDVYKYSLLFQSLHAKTDKLSARTMSMLWSLVAVILKKGKVPPSRFSTRRAASAPPASYHVSSTKSPTRAARGALVSSRSILKRYVFTIFLKVLL